ncbi:hypothetical protein F52700_4888 [Fusarium sp. NRRL 52700]|nr:hypothetical protein F52700_4888 [Fusarium sp. NRRL 52700]
MSLSEKAEALASKVPPAYSGAPKSGIVLSAATKGDGLQSKLGDEEKKTEHQSSGSDSQKIPASQPAHKGPDVKDQTSTIKNDSPPKKENEEHRETSEVEKENGKDHGQKKGDAGDKSDEETLLNTSEKDKKSGDSKEDGKETAPSEDKDTKGQDVEGGDSIPKDKAYAKDSDKANEKGKKDEDKNESPEVPTPPSSKDLGVDGFLASPSEKASAFQEKDRSWEADGYTASNGLDDFAKKHEASQLVEDQWLEILENCNAMYGWCVDGPNKEIVRAPKPAFQLRVMPPPEKPLNSPPAHSEGIKTATSSQGIDTPTRPSSSFTSGSFNLKSRTKPKTASSNNVTSVKGLASSATGRVSARDPQTSVIPGSSQQEPSTTSTKNPKPPTSNAARSSSGSETPRRVLPDFSINDNSRIDIVISSHEFQTSMATNDFSASSTSASLGGSYGPISASVSYSTESTHSSSTLNTSDAYNKTMIAKYMFPRVDLNLDSCLEPTQGLKDAIAKVEATKNIKDLHQLRHDYGYLFCKSVTVGGRLQTQAVMDQSSTTSEQEQKQSLKTSVGLAVSAPKVSASVSHTEESGSDKSSSQGQSDKSESHVFEAMGGDSLLASNPLAWIPTVGSYKNWRIINRNGLTLMSDMISSLSGYEHTRSWFEQAVPALSKYIEFSHSTVKKIRLRLMSPNHHLCLSYKKGSDDPDYAVPPNYYLGHRTLSTVMPLAMELEYSDEPWGRIQMPNNKPEFLFSPGSYRAPAIYGYSANKVGENLYGTKYDDEFRSTIWSITSPYDDALCHGSRVIIQITSPGSKSTPNITGDSGNNTLSVTTAKSVISSLIVFRNQQGVFLPAMTDAKDVHIWRILKKGVVPGDKPNIAEGDEVQLAWSFQDQYCGYRDFTEDAFGRRRNNPPPGSNGPLLYMRLPWPRFEPVESLADQIQPLPNALIMSEAVASQNNPSPILSDKIQVIHGEEQAVKDIVVEDCIFRLDVVKHHGRGDVDDYLLRGVSQEAMFPDIVERQALNKQVESERLAREAAERLLWQQDEAIAGQVEEEEIEGAGETLMHIAFPLTMFF